MLPNRTIKIVIADRFEIFRCGYRQIIEATGKPFFEVIAEAATGIELVEKVKSLQPDIVITDINMSASDNVSACRIIQQIHPSVKTIILSPVDQENLLMEMVTTGSANGYLVKHANKADLWDALITVSDGFPYYCGTTTKMLFETVQTNSKKEKKVQFSVQEMKVIRLICKQLTTKEIAHTLRLGNRSVEDYRHNIQEKIGAKNAVGIGLYALINGLVTLTEL